MPPKIMGCPSSGSSGALSSYDLRPAVVHSNWESGATTYGAYFYRETFFESAGKLSVLENNGVPRDAILMDYSTDQGGGNTITMHKFEWTNILYRDGHGTGTANSQELGSPFTTDFSLGINETVWGNADATDN